MIDYDYILKDAGLVAESAVGEVAATAVIIDVGAGLVEGHMILDVTAIEIASNNEEYDIELQGSSLSGFGGTYTVLASMKLGANEVLDSDLDSTIGRYEVPFRSEKNGTNYRYLREYCSCGGSIATGINFAAYLGK